MTALIYVIIIVALLTYLAMFNINSLAQGFGQVYGIKKKHIVHAMKNDRKESWKLRGQRFEVFRPKHENPEPSEWYIPLYALMHPMAVLGLGRNNTAAATSMAPYKEKASRTSFEARIAGLFCRRKNETKGPEEPDQPWVIEPFNRQSTLHRKGQVSATANHVRPIPKTSPHEMISDTHLAP